MSDTVEDMKDGQNSVWREDSLMGSKTQRVIRRAYSPLFSSFDTFVDISPEDVDFIRPEDISEILKINAV
ncbi:MAG: hypothetical protein ACRCX2_15770, partial [Paraclostridium sp.]